MRPVPQPLTLLALLIPLLAACTPDAPLRETPDAIAGLPLHHRIDGPRALGAVGRLHHAPDVGLDSAWIAAYGDADQAIMLYVGIAPDTATAQRLVADMRTRLAGQRTPFRFLEERSVGDIHVQVLTGQGQRHYVFTEGRRAVWLSADSALAPHALAQVLGTD